MRNLAIAAVAALAVPASATVYDFSYTTDALYGAADVTGQLTIGDTPLYGSIYGVTAVSGTRNGVAIDGLDEFGWGFNEYDSATQYIDFSFLVGAVSYNLYRQAPSVWTEYDGTYGRTSTNFTMTPATAEVPEPAMLGLFGMGALGLGLARRRRG